MSNFLASDARRVATVRLIDGRTVSDEQLSPHLARLSPGELERYQRFVRPERQRQFLIGRTLLRDSLQKLFGMQASDISFSERRGQAPMLLSAGLSPQVSVSHSGPWVACALSDQTALGLDIEVLNPERDLLALSEQAFCIEDANKIKLLQGEARVQAFYACWSRQEALYKLASTSSSGPTVSCMQLSHPDISIVLCSAFPLAVQPVIELVNWTSSA